MLLRNPGRSECPSSGKGHGHGFDTFHSNCAASKQQRNSISNATVGTRLDLSEGERLRVNLRIAAECRLTQIVVDQSRLMESVQYQSFFRGRVPVRILRSNVDGAVDPR